MKQRKSLLKLGVSVLVVLMAAMLFGCGGQQTKPANQPSEPVALDPPLAKSYKIVLIDQMTIPAELEKDYREALNQCRQSAIWALQDKKCYEQVDRFQGSPMRPEDTLIMKINVSDMRMVSGTARFWVGAMAGSSYMNMDVSFIDGATQTVVRSKEISSSNNPFGAAWTGGSTDQNLPSDMGKIIAEYIHSVIPKE